MESVTREYFDYYNMAQKLEYDLANPVVLYPKDIKNAHDLAVANYNALKAEIKAKKNAEKEKKAFEMLLKKDKQYVYTDGKYLITVPHTIADIVREGKLQQHCVGGYAARHMDGVLTICFMRAVTEPDKPLYTIEMHDKSLTQVQGFGNRTPLTEEAQAFFDTWMQWVKGGSKRNKSGEPIIKKSKAVKSA